jgi:cell wall-associated NlpC family hydrolase
MMFQRRPFISQREKTLALRDTGQSRHRRDHEVVRPASAARARCIRSYPETQGDGTVALRHKVGTIAGTMAVSLAFFSGTASAHTLSFNQKAASYVETFIGRVPYTYGGTSPRSGFDCSGLAQYVYGHYGKSIPRTAEAQFLRFRRESKHAAWGGDLVFFHVDSDPNSYVYHVAIYEGDNHIVSATDPAQGIAWQRIWSSDVTFGTITH